MSAKADPQKIDFTESEGTTITVYHKDSGGTLDFDFSGLAKEVVKGTTAIITEAVKKPPVVQRERETLPVQPAPPPVTNPAPSRTDQPPVTTPAKLPPQLPMPSDDEVTKQGGGLTGSAKVGLALGAAALLAAIYLATKGPSEPKIEKGLAV